MGLVGDHVGEARVVRGPAQQQVVVRHHQVRPAERPAAPAEGAVALAGALLPGALLGAEGHRTPAQVAQGREAHQQRAGQGADLAVGSQARTGGEGGEGQPVLGEQSRLATLGEHGLAAALAHVVGAALDGECLEVRVAQHGGRRGDVLLEQLVLQELRARGDHDGLAHAAGGALHGEGDGGRQVGEGLPHPGSPFEHQPPALGEHRVELARHLHLGLAHPVAGEVAAAARLVPERRRNGVGVEGHGLLVGERDLDVLGQDVGVGREARRVEQRQPGRAGSVDRQRVARGAVARVAVPGPGGGDAQHRGGVDGIGEGPVPLLPLEQLPGEGLEAQVGGVRVCDGEQVLGVEEDALAKARGDEALEEVALEGSVVRDDHATRQQPFQHRGHALDAGRIRHVRLGDARERAHRPGDAAAGLHEAREGLHPGGARVEQHAAHLEDLHRSVAWQAGGLEVHHRHGAMARAGSPAGRRGRGPASRDRPPRPAGPKRC